MIKRRLPWMAVTVVILGIINFWAFIIISVAIGGDALNGRVIDGRYFVMSHGTFTEVTQTVWIASRIHTVVTFVSFPGVGLAFAYLLFHHVFPFLMSGKAPGHAAERVATLRASGALLWQGSPGGMSGGMSASAGMLGAEVYRDGIVVTPRFMPASAILAGEIRSVQLGRRLRTSTIEVEHAGIDTLSPLILYGGPDSPQARALMALASGDTTDIPPLAPPRASGGPVPGWPTTPTVATARPTHDLPTATLMRVLGLLGLIVGIVMVAVGLLVIIPSFGPVGLVWTGTAALILIVNARRFIRRGW